MNCTFVVNPRLIHSIKTAFACLTGLAVASTAHIPIAQWIVITIIVVMCAQVSVGGVIQKSYMRFLGTIAGSGFAALTIYFFNAHSFAILCAITISAAAFSYLATSPTRYQDAGTLGAVTVAIILFSDQPTLWVVMERCIEITLGILIAALVSQFVLPIHARSNLRLTIAETLLQLRDYYSQVLIAEPAANHNYQALDERIIKSLAKQRILAAESSREPLGKPFDLARFNQLLQCQKEILRGTIFMQYAVDAASTARKYFSDSEVLKHFHQAICESLLQIAIQFKAKDNLTSSIPLPSLLPLKQALLSLKPKLNVDEEIHIDAILFGAQILIKRLNELHHLQSHSLK